MGLNDDAFCAENYPTFSRSIHAWMRMMMLDGGWCEVESKIYKEIILLRLTLHSAVGQFMRKELLWPCKSEIYLTLLHTYYGSLCWTDGWQRRRRRRWRFLQIIDFTCRDDDKKVFNFCLWTYCEAGRRSLSSTGWVEGCSHCCAPRCHKFDDILRRSMA